MRDKFGQVVSELMTEQDDIYFVFGDTGNVTVAKNSAAYPERFINGGIAEQAIAGIAAGIAKEGARVIVNSIANFPTLRCLEQVRNDAVYHDLNVKFCATGGGLSYGPAGVTHHASEDFSLISAIPNIKIYAPGDPYEVEACTRLMMETDGPAYMRIGYHGEPNINKGPIQDLHVGQAICQREGDTVAIFTAGSSLEEGAKACEILNNDGISTALYSFPTIVPIDEELIVKKAKECRLIVTLEENYAHGGLGSIVAEILAAQSERTAVLRRIGLHELPTIIGDRKYLQKVYHVDSETVVNTVKDFLHK
jgi:transketolase